MHRFGNGRAGFREGFKAQAGLRLSSKHRTNIKRTQTLAELEEHTYIKIKTGYLQRLPLKLQKRRSKRVPKSLFSALHFH